MSKKKIYSEFIDSIWRHYRQHRRDFLWRRTTNPYRILVSEVMLQQTQTQRVEQKYRSFLKRFPNLKALAQASLAEVLGEWQGLGYNRRGVYLKRTAERIMEDYHGRMPRDEKALLALPGIGKSTAAGICAFAFNQPVIYLETNIRRVYIHFFFKGKDKVSDTEIISLMEKTLDHDRPRDWYYALMDYGVMLAKQGENPNRRSAHYTRQSKFEGSRRQIRGRILKLLLEHKKLSKEEICAHFPPDEDRVGQVLHLLEQEGIVMLERGGYVIEN